MKTLFVKPATAIALDFAGDPQFGLRTERFSGSTTATLSTVSFVMRTASLR
jgi:hypothetical protein